MDEDSRVLENEENANVEESSVNRRGFLMGLRKWSLAVIGGALLGGALLTPEREADARGAWANAHGGGGGAWANRGGGGGGAWANHGGGGGAWANRGGGAWVNGGGGWINRGGSWVNRW